MDPAKQKKIDELDMLMGRIIRIWSNVDFHLMLILAGIVCNPDLARARIIWASMMNFRAKRELIVRLGESYLPEKSLERFRALMAQVKHLSEKRNMIAHDRVLGPWEDPISFHNDQDPTQPNTFGRFSNVQRGNLKSWIKELEDLANALLRFHGEIVTSPLLEKPRLLPEQPDDPSPDSDPAQGGDAKQ